MDELLKDPMNFYIIAFIIFLFLAYWKGRKPMLAWLDSGIIDIRKELDEAKALRAEAEAMLADYKKRQTEAMSEAEAIIRYAQQEASRLKAQADGDLKSMLAKHEQQFSDRLRIAESEALADVRRAAVHQAIDMARATLQSKIDDAAGSKLVDQAIAELTMLAGAKAKAA